MFISDHLRQRTVVGRRTSVLVWCWQLPEGVSFNPGSRLGDEQDQHGINCLERQTRRTMLIFIALSISPDLSSVSFLIVLWALETLLGGNRVVAERASSGEPTARTVIESE